MTRSIAASVLTVAFLGAGCTYTENRLKDLVDIIGVGGGIGIGSNFRVTHYFQTTSLYPHFGGPRFKLVGRRMEAPTGPSLEWGFAPLVYFRGNVVNAKDQTRSVVLCKTLMDGKSDPNWQRWYDTRLWGFPEIREYERNYDRRLFDIGFAAYFILGFEFDFNPYELIDFFLGFTTLDIALDDYDPNVETAAAPDRG